MFIARVDLPSAGPCGEDEEVAALQAPEGVVQVDESGGYRGDAVVERGGVGRLFEVLVQYLSDRHEVPGNVGVTDSEKEDILRPFERLVRVGCILVADRGDVARGLNEPPHGGRAVDDAGEVLRVDGRGNGSDDVAEIAGAANLLQPLPERQLTGDADLVNGFAAVVERLAGLVAPAVALAVEVAGHLDERRYAVDHLPVYEE